MVDDDEIDRRISSAASTIGPQEIVKSSQTTRKTKSSAPKKPNQKKVVIKSAVKAEKP